MTPQPTYQPGWYADPEGRYDFRYHNGSTWTNDVSRDGERLLDGAVPGGDTAGGGEQRHRDRRATTALVLAIIGLCLAWMPLFFVAGAACALVAIVLGASARRRVPRDSRGFAGLSMVIAGAALVVCALGIWLTFWIYDLIDAYENPPATEVRELVCVADGSAVTVTGTLLNIGDRGSRFRVVVDVEADVDTDRSDGPRRYAVPIDVAAIEPGESTGFTATRAIRTDTVGTLSCSVGAVTGPPPLGITV